MEINKKLEKMAIKVQVIKSKSEFQVNSILNSTINLLYPYFNFTDLHINCIDSELSRCDIPKCTADWYIRKLVVFMIGSEIYFYDCNDRIIPTELVVNHIKEHKQISYSEFISYAN